MTKPQIQLTQTEDGSPTLYNPQFGEHYHSIHGAIQESRHIFIEAGLRARLHRAVDTPLCILEVGFGTGLNALLTALDAQSTVPIHYTSLELYPITADTYETLHFKIGHTLQDPCLQELHQAPWGYDYSLKTAPQFTLQKLERALQDYQHQGKALDLIYFDAFSPEAQEELWEESIFRLLYEASQDGAYLVTYCAKGEVRRRLQRAGWQVERLPGPPGKREMLRGTKFAVKQLENK